MTKDKYARFKHGFRIAFSHSKFTEYDSQSQDHRNIQERTARVTGTHRNVQLGPLEHTGTYS